MNTIIIPHRDNAKGGATEHVDAIIKALKETDAQYDAFIADPIENLYDTVDGKKVLLPLNGRAETLKEKYGDANYIVITGDYGADQQLGDLSTAAAFKSALGGDCKVIMSSYTIEPQQIVEEMRKDNIDYLAVPTHAISPFVVSTMTNDLLNVWRVNGRIIETIGVPHLVTRELCATKREEWNAAAAEEKVEELPVLLPHQQLTLVVLPGDVENKDGKPLLFTEADAKKLADEIAKSVPSNGKVLFSNGPRTGKYNASKFDADDFNAAHPNFQNADRMNGLTSNPVALAFYNRLAAHVGDRNIIDGCIAKGIVPAQGFLAFYDLANEHAAKGGPVTAFIDGVSTTMLAQAANVFDDGVGIVACDTPAKNKTHIAGMNDLFERGQISILRLNAEGYQMELASKFRTPDMRFDDASTVVNRIVEIAGLQAPTPNMPVRKAGQKAAKTLDS